MKSLFTALFVFTVLFGQISSAKAGAKFVPMETIVSKFGLQKSVSRGNGFCISSEGYRSSPVQGGRKHSYVRAVYYIFEQRELAQDGYGELMVSSDTKCYEGYIRGVDTYLKFRSIGLYAPMFQLQPWYPVSLKVDSASKFCRAKSLGVAYDRMFSSSDFWKEKSFSMVAFEINEINGLMKIKAAPYEMWEMYVSRDVQCFSTQKEALKGGYRLIIW